MKRLFLGILILFFFVPAWADLLLPQQQKERMKKVYEEGLAKCPADKPLYNGEKCYSCDELKSITVSSVMKCSEICPNRFVRYECMPRCILKNPPNENYTYVECEGWILK